MQVNEHTGQVRQGPRLPAMNRARSDARRTGTKLPENIEQNPDGQEAAARTTRKPRRYGAGF